MAMLGQGAQAFVQNLLTPIYAKRPEWSQREKDIANAQALSQAYGQLGVKTPEGMMPRLEGGVNFGPFQVPGRYVGASVPPINSSPVSTVKSLSL